MEFKTIPNFTAYEVSRCGTVVRRISNRKEVKQSFQMIKGKPSGYLYCTLLFDEHGQYLTTPKRIAVHRLVAFAWQLPPLPGEVWVNHIDGNKSNNHALNLEWTTISANIQHAFNTGLKSIPKGPDHWLYGRKSSLITKQKQSAAKQGEQHPKFKGYYFVNFKRYTSANSAARELKISPKTILNRCKNEKWRLKGWYFVPVNKD